MVESTVDDFFDLIMLLVVNYFRRRMLRSCRRYKTKVRSEAERGLLGVRRQGSGLGTWLQRSGAVPCSPRFRGFGVESNKSVSPSKRLSRDKSS